MENFKYIFGLTLIWILGSCDSYEEVIPDPQIRIISADQAELIEAFSGLTGGDQTACNLVYETESIPDVLCRIVSGAQVGSEIVFLVDKTGSMENDIDEVRRSISDIIDCLPEGVRLGAGAYGDRNVDGNNWYSRTTLSDDFQVVRDFVNTLAVTGGGDYPESVYDALWVTLDQMPWRDCSAPDQIIVMGDAPPLRGNRTMYDLEDVLAKADSICPSTAFYPVLIIED